ncbi:MAG: FkbM family methyltransferase [Chitinophagaceae bacterium]|nr:FkbM family methyltransferase [Chitinophagaceae bacterium]MBN8666787.1 FkbM family methyltransferase [Chitinophagales bacterium]
MLSIVGRVLGRNSRLFRELIVFRRFGWNRPRWLSGLDKVLQTYNACKNGVVRFVQIGSNDGMSGDPLHKYIKKYEWRGILVEPMQSIFDRLVANYQGEQQRLYFANVAVGPADGFSSFFYVDDKAKELPEWASQLSSFNRDVIEKHTAYFPGIQDRIKEIAIETLRIDSLLERFQFYEVDLVHIDTEGSDYETLKTINFDRISPDIIIYEHKHLSSREAQESVSLLRKWGYKLYICGGDCLAVKKTMALNF